MPVTLASPQYDLVLNTGDGRQLYLREVLGSPSWEESLEESAVRLRCTFSAPNQAELAALLRGSQGLALTGLPFGKAEPIQLWQGIVWSVTEGIKRAPNLPLTAYDHLIYATKHQDDWLYEAGQTATAIIRHSAAKLGIPIGTLAETGVALKRQLQRGATLWKLWTDALRETAKLGGGLYRLRMDGGKLHLVQLGANSTVWLLEVGQNVMDGELPWSRDGVTTTVKVVGQADGDTTRPTLAIYEDKELTRQHGRIQRVLSDPDVETAGAAMELGRQAVRGPEETASLTAPDINTLRAGDAVVLRMDGKDYRLIVDQVEHDGARGPGTMRLTLATEQQIRWRWIVP